MTGLEFYHHDVRRFKLEMGLLVNDGAPALLNDFETALQLKLINEEVGETVTGIRKSDPIETIDGLCDTLYVTLGAALAYGYRLYVWVPTLPDCRDVSIATRPMFVFGDLYADYLLGAFRNIDTASQARDLYALGPALAGMVSAIGVILEAWKIPLRPFWNEVQAANMRKLGGGVREDGKRMKPVGWKGPDHLPILSKMFGLEFVGKYVR